MDVMVVKELQYSKTVESSMNRAHNQSLHLTAIPLRSIAAGELGR